MSNQRNLMFAGGDLLGRNKRYLVWFWLLNLLFGWLGALGLGTLAGGILNHSLYADKLLHGFDLSVLVDLISRPEFGPITSTTVPALIFALLFFMASLFLMPGVLLGFSSDHRISRGEFYRACGHNLWRFVRLCLFFLVIGGAVAGILGSLQVAMIKAADKTSYELLPFITRMVMMVIIFVALSFVRGAFDLAQAEVVLRDEAATRKSLSRGFRAAWHNLGRLLGSYVVIGVITDVILAAGIVLWNQIVPPASVFGGFLIAQLILILLLTMRFWQRAVAVEFYLRRLGESEMDTVQPIPATVPAS
jgi:hypothetical protein